MGAIQVLRVHLLELEKVNELCEDFSSRYIISLQTQLQQERMERNADDVDFDSPMSSPTAISPPAVSRRHSFNVIAVCSPQHTIFT